MSLRTKAKHPGNLSPKDLLARRDFLTSAFQWLESEGGIVLGRSSLPASLLSDPPDDLADAIYEVLREISGRINDESDVKALMNCQLRVARFLQ